MYTMRQMCRMSGLSARALRFYDEQGLLKPAEVSGSGCRLYDEQTAARARQILAYRSTGMRLGEIRRVLDSGDAEYAKQALRRRTKVLQEEQSRLERMLHCTSGLLEALEKNTLGGDMEDRYTDEVQQRWGDSAAFKDYAERLKTTGPEAMELAGAALMDILASLGELRGTEPNSPRAQELAEQLHKHISANFYDCSPQILAGLADMYADDPRFRRNIDKKGGEGTAAFARDAIRAYCTAQQ